MSSHSPGTWTLELDHIVARDSAGLALANDNESVAKVMGPDARANGRLIAAAPDLLAVCKLAARSWFNGEVSEIHMETQLRAAIAKAEGKTA